ncbi:flagellar basal body rod protein [Bacillus haikouensis]|jgi:lia operon protein LiaI|uniref:lmo0954 family membrane protein n=1 Tax=Bacillus haikouensis TaxID=1510468 RepID=UPI001554388C|nr:flagellar basal body rod protein [Bacillus haikouensis]NQD65653.1 flagellar basal body rod protein [Bacillus haikouensis]
MKKFGLLLAGGIAAIVLIANLGPIVGLALSVLIMYYSFKQFIRTDSTFKKIIWALIGLAAFSATISNFPAIIGLVALYIIYVIYKNWKKDEIIVEEKSNDPFTNFEKEWSQLKN